MSVCCPEMGIIIKEGLVQPRYTAEGHYTLSYQPVDARAQTLICGPIGYEGVIAIRSLNHLARQLAKTSIGSLRFDYKGTGESAGSSYSPSSMLSDRQAAAGYMPSSHAAGAVGAGFGAYPALFGSHAEEDFLVLWDPVVDGRAFADKIRSDSKGHMFRRLLPWAAAELQGFTYSQTLLKQLAAVDLRARTQPVAPRVLVIAQQALPDIEPLAECLTDLGSEVSVVRHNEELLGTGSLVTVPSNVIREIAAWI